MRSPLKQIAALASALTVAAAGCERAPATNQPASDASDPIALGRHLVMIAGCNDCHTVGWEEQYRTLPESAWLTGSPLGWNGPWGTTYAPNLRRNVPLLTEDAFVKMAHERTDRPPMPWPSLDRMRDEELRAIYRFIVSLGVAGEAAPAYMPPDQTPPLPYVQFVLPAPTE